MRVGQALHPPTDGRFGSALDKILRQFSAFWLPGLVALFSLWALIMWPNQYATRTASPLSFSVLSSPSDSELSPAQALARLAQQPTLQRWDSHLAETPDWFLLSLPATRSDIPQAVEFPSRHAVAMQCWDAATLSELGYADRNTQRGAMDSVRAGFFLRPAPGLAAVLCRATFLGPARFTAQTWSLDDLQTKDQEFHNNAGLLGGGLLVLAAFILIAGFVNRDKQYLVFAAWLVVNLRMAALSAGWDDQWLGHVIPFQWLVHVRPVTLALYYMVTFVLFVSLFENELPKVSRLPVLLVARWSCLPLLVASLVLPYAVFLPIIWVATGLGIAGLVYLLTLMLLRDRSTVALWYSASITVALFASFYEVLSAALSFQGWIGTINSVTAALLSSLLASMAIAEQIRIDHLQKQEAQAELAHTYEVIPVGLFTLDTTGRFLSANPALKEMLGPLVLEHGADHWSHYFGPQGWQTLAQQTVAGAPVEMVLRLDSQGLNPKHIMVRATWAKGRIEGTMQDVTEKTRATEHLEFLANHDPLTRVLNRRGIEAALERGLNGLVKGEPLAVAYLDLDRFKLINDLYGHVAGDEVLQQVCFRALRPLNAHMLMGRIGGDEFLIVMGNTPLAQAEAVSREIVTTLSSTPYAVGERAFQVRGSIGLIEVRPGMSSKDIVSTADRACREAKKGHGIGLTVYEKGSKVFTDHEAELQLVERLATQQQIEGLFLEMQPIMSLRAPYQSLNFEVLLRMQDENGDRVPTDRLIHAGENAGRMGVIDRWVLNNTLQWLVQHKANLAPNQFVCLNLSGASLNDERFMEDVFELLDKHTDIAQSLCLEITESVALNDMGNTRRFIDRVRQVGAKVALDDFGAGYTSFSYLKDLPADLLKIDGSFIVNMNRHPANIAIVEAIVSLAQNLGMKTIAEWAEDFETVQTLAEIGVDYVQGFIVARPQNPANLLTAQSSAAFISDDNLNQYLGELAAPGDGLANVDLVLGPPSTDTPKS